jgi:hypothetical protein
LFGSCIVQTLNTGVLKFKENSGAKELRLPEDGADVLKHVTVLTVYKILII